MSWEAALLLVGLLLVALLVSGLPIPFALGVAGVAVLGAHGDARALASIGNVGWNTVESFILTSVPLFLFMGEVILRSGLSTRFYRGVAVWLSGVTGQLLHSNVVASAIFSAVCGSSVATAAAIGTVAVPEMRTRGYEPRMVYGTIAAGGALGNLIPPGIAQIIYAAMVDQSVAKLFIGSVIPGVMVTLLFMAFIWVAVRLRPRLVPREETRPVARDYARALADVFPVVALMVAVLGSLWFGIATPTESAAIGAAGAVVLAVAYRGFTWAGLRSALVGTTRVTCMVLFIIVGAQILSFSLVKVGLNRQVTEWVVGLGLGKWALFAVIVVVYMLLGMLIDGISMMVLTLPVLYPIVVNAGFDPIWFGVVLTSLIELGLLTPPVGMVLFVIQGISGAPLAEVARGALPFMLLLLAGIVLMAVFPQTVLWLPALISPR
ncbi:MAG: TRAP transporter large permease subunit [Candidatus Rokubacteria bacterium]|nr:TRAP transporter large permease subunit [Candidatus Rokubacteria bacterium]MBI2491535.1 TRAP transporter large permease subunit [Candidatus Rokubacteria bacterium]MBI4255255.1 TRAP transporter large permease subunit [Candidatus Rokubacteria bacterium]MBI4627199.1 TRAP transporter large permease subunit [Candidatus Rokubacteria bacterium]